MSMVEWQNEVALEEARQLSLALEASKREAYGLPSEDLIHVSACAHTTNFDHWNFCRSGMC